MLVEVRVEDFRCLRDFEVLGLGRINLIAGKNGVGKSSFLDAIYCFSGSGVGRIYGKTEGGRELVVGRDRLRVSYSEFFDFNFVKDVIIDVLRLFEIEIFDVVGSGGMLKVVKLFSSMLFSDIVLVDGFESGLHYSILESLWRKVAEVSRRVGCQVFATTYSYECIVSASVVDELSFYRFERVDGKIVARRYDIETLRSSLELGIEVR